MPMAKNKPVNVGALLGTIGKPPDGGGSGSSPIGGTGGKRGGDVVIGCVVVAVVVVVVVVIVVVIVVVVVVGGGGGAAAKMYAAPEFAALVPGLSLLEGGALFGVVSMPVAFSISLICLYSSEFGSRPSSIDAPAADPTPPNAPAAIVRPSADVDTDQPK